MASTRRCPVTWRHSDLCQPRRVVSSAWRRIVVNVDELGRTREKDDGPHFGRLITRPEPSDASDSSQGDEAVSELTAASASSTGPPADRIPSALSGSDPRKQQDPTFRQSPYRYFNRSSLITHRESLILESLNPRLHSRRHILLVSLPPPSAQSSSDAQSRIQPSRVSQRLTVCT